MVQAEILFMKTSSSRHVPVTQHYHQFTDICLNAWHPKL